MARQINGHLGTFDTIAALTAKFPPSESIGCSANVGTAIPYTKAWCNGSEWALVQAPQIQALVSSAWNFDGLAAMVAAIGWDTTTWPVALSVDIYSPSSPRGSAGLTLRQALEIAHPEWESWTTLWVDFGAGVNGTGTEVSPFNTGYSAVAAATAGGQSGYIIRCKGSPTVVPRTRNFSNGSATKPGTHLVWVSYGGRSTVGSHGPLTWTADATYSWCYTVSRTLVNCVVDLAARTLKGTYPRLRKVATAAICSRTPNSWYTDGTVVLVNRADGAAVTDTNTRAYLSVGNILSDGATQYTWAMLAETSSDGFDIEGGGNEGGSPAGPMSFLYTGNTGSRTIVVGAENSTIRYGGSLTNATGNIAINSVNGLIRFDNCDYTDGVTDLLNVHNSLFPAAQPYVLTTNCTGSLAGQLSPYTANNSWTLHEDVIGISLCDRYDYARGVTLHCVNESKALVVAPVLGNSQGDQMHGGVFPSTEARIDGTGVMYLVNPIFTSSQAGPARVVAGDTSQLFYRGLVASELQVASGATATAV